MLKRFNFFEKKLIKEGILSSPQLNVSSVTYSEDHLIVGTKEGLIYIVDSFFREVNSFRALHSEVKHVIHAQNKDILLTVGEGDDGRPIIKLWDMYDSATGPSEIIHSIKLSDIHDRCFPIDCCAANADMTMLALGLGDGSFLFYSGDITSNRLNRQRVVACEGFPITYLEFIEDDEEICLFVGTDANITAYYVAYSDFGRDVEVLDDFMGIARGLGATSQNLELVVGRNEGFFYYINSARLDKIDQGSGTLPNKGERKMITTFKNYLVSVDFANNEKFNTLTIIDNSVVIDNSKTPFIAFTNSFQDISHIIVVWDMILVFTNDKKVYQLLEKDLHSKLEPLFKNSLYKLAIALAKRNNQSDANTVVEIFRKYGDYLYGLADYDGSIEQYIKTIRKDSKLEASYVIKKFLDAQRIHNLTLYLQKLHEAGFAEKAHTTLLLNCYTKLKQHEKLDEFIKTPNLSFDVSTAIKVCRQAGYFYQALDLAQINQQHDWYLKILIEDMKNYQDAFHYIEEIASTDFDSAVENMKKYGKVLLEELPDETTSFLMLICTSYIPMNSHDDVPRKYSAPAEEFIHIFVNSSEKLLGFLEVITAQNKGTIQTTNTLLELYLKNEGGKFGEDERRQLALTLIEEHECDTGQAMVLCQMHDFPEGILKLYEKMSLSDEVIQYYMDQNDYENVIISCKKFGKKDPNLWIKALTYFANKDASLDCREQISEILQQIDEAQLLPPLQIIKILSKSPNAYLGLIKPYISNHLQREQIQIKEDQKKISNHIKVTENNKKEIHRLTSGAILIQNTKCNYCNDQLTLPAVHFLCSHSFHQYCLGDENECPECRREISTFRNRQKSLEEGRKQHKEFFRQLEYSPDGFSVVSKFFSRGLFSNQPKADPNQPLNLKFDFGDLDLLHYDNHN
eukprot:TRINITY_DN9066_c0_g1_i1.p1 TRINITY_DN9066_c0_g1~~TRINITY_DN9066_c0_g1_i1.p1  ORF type:complete len:909 (+),score=191.88 TRINITY_DN9066_c0_g1_i1:149-2875(+)